MKLFVASVLLLVGILGCSSSNKGNIVPAIVPQSQKSPTIKVVRPNNIIGEIEPLYMLPMKSAFSARIAA